MTAEPDRSGQGVLFAYGFRPFFLLAGIYAVLSMLPWLGWLLVHSLGAIVLEPTTLFPALLWHAHEMLFGFVAAVMAGFFLTAMPNWTGTAPVRGAALAGLVLLWILGRAAVWFGAFLPGWLAATLDLAFLPALAALVAVILWRARAVRNLILVPVLLLLAVGNLLIHLEVLEIADDIATTGLYLAADTVAVLLVIIGGRIVPAFTRGALKPTGADAAVRSTPLVDRLSIAAVVLLIPLDLLDPDSVVAGLVAAAAALVNAVRLVRWQGQRTLRQPILWVLHLGYLWIVLSFAGKAAAVLVGWPSPSAALHALTVGAIGTLTLGVMTRAALGHTGRPLVAHKAVAVAYGLVSLAALARVAGPALLPTAYIEVIMASGGLWTAAFAIFVAVYFPVLTQPRRDGKPG